MLVEHQTTGGPSAMLSMARSFAELARTLSTLTTEDATWQAIVAAAISTIGGAQDADITILRGDKFRTVAPSRDTLVAVDAIQYELRSGPCVDAILEQAVFRTGDLAHDARWPEFGRRAAAEYGINSMLAFRLYLEDDDTIGCLNVFSTEHEAFDESSVTAGHIIATHAAIAMSGARSRGEAENLRLALGTNREIGIAMGIVMSRYTVTQQEAFDLLRLTSQRTQRKLRDVASDVAHTGTLELPA